MIVGYLLVAAVVALAAIAVAVFLQASFWTVFGVYALVGSATLLLLPFAHLAMRRDRVVSGGAEREEAASTLQPMEAQAKEARAPSMRILAVDDDPFILELIPMLSAKAGFPSVTAAASGDEALTFLAGTDLRFDCFLFDISMPGMDGLELCRRIRQMPHYAKTPIVMLTALRDLQNLGDAYRAGATDYATKPFDIEELGIRLRLAQAAGLAGHDADRQRNAHNRSGAVHENRLDLPTGVEGLVEHTALASYLTRVPKSEVSGMQVYAVSFDGLDAIEAGAPRHQINAVLKEACLAAAQCFEPGRFVMAYTDSGTLLIACSSNTSPAALSVEADIQTWLRDKGCDLDVAVGGPVQLYGPKTERARLSIDVAVTRAELRIYEKKDGPYARAEAY